MKFGSPIPVLRMFDEAKAREFYLGFLGFTVDWEHRFEPGLPLYMQVSRGSLLLHLSEHHGDCSPGAQVRIEVDDVDALERELLAREYNYSRPRAETMPWGTRDLQAIDPFGNKLTFYTEQAAPQG